MERRAVKLKGLQREMLGIPLYAWLAGGAALLLSILYFTKHKGAQTASTPAGATAGSYPQNIYDSTNVYNQPGSAPGAASASPAPQLTMNPWWKHPSIRPVLPVSSGGPPDWRRNLQPVGTAAPGFGGGLYGDTPGNQQAALMPHPIQPNRWQPVMNSDLFGSGPGSGAPVSPTIVWNMTPTQAYTQS